MVTLRSRRGEIEVKAQVTEDIKEGVVWTTPHFAAASANRLTNDVLDERGEDTRVQGRGGGHRGHRL